MEASQPSALWIPKQKVAQAISEFVNNVGIPDILLSA
jgi:hypothetical protein